MNSYSKFLDGIYEDIESPKRLKKEYTWRNNKKIFTEEERKKRKREATRKWRERLKYNAIKFRVNFLIL